MFVSGTGRRLHAPPSVIGAIADAADTKMLVISHLMQRSLKDIEKNVELITSKFDGKLSIATDLHCYEINYQEK